MRRKGLHPTEACCSWSVRRGVNLQIERHSPRPVSADWLCLDKTHRLSHKNEGNF